MKKINFDERCLDNLNIEEIRSLLKSNVMDWDLREKIREILGTKIAVRIITDSLPVVVTVALIVALVGFVKKCLREL